MSALSPAMVTAMRLIGAGAATAHEMGINGCTMAQLAERGLVRADKQGTPTVYEATPAGLTLIAYLTSPPRPIEREWAVARIQRIVAGRFDIPLIEMTSHRRAREVVRPRQIAMYLAKQTTEKSLPKIGRLFGNRDHTTVIHAVRKVEQLSRDDRAFAATVAELKSAILSTENAGSGDNGNQSLVPTHAMQA